MSNKTYNFINGAFLTKHPKYEIINLAFTEEFLKNLEALPKDAKGFRKVQLSQQKSNPLKWSIFEDQFVPDPTKGKGGGSNQSGSIDDLPF